METLPVVERLAHKTETAKYSLAKESQPEEKGGRRRWTFPFARHDWPLSPMGSGC
jgi:hypothetical protein